MIEGTRRLREGFQYLNINILLRGIASRIFTRMFELLEGTIGESCGLRVAVQSRALVEQAKM